MNKRKFQRQKKDKATFKTEKKEQKYGDMRDKTLKRCFNISGAIMLSVISVLSITPIVTLIAEFWYKISFADMLIKFGIFALMAIVGLIVSGVLSFGIYHLFLNPQKK